MGYVTGQQPVLLEPGIPAQNPRGGPQGGLGCEEAVGSGPTPPPASPPQREGGCQQGGAGNPRVLQGQGEAGGVSRRVSAAGGSLGVGGSARASLHAASPPPQRCLRGAAFCSHAPQAPGAHHPPQTPVR